MFKWFKKNKPPQVGPDEPHNRMFMDALSNSPFAKNLCERALKIHLEAYDDLKDMVGKVREIEPSSTLEDFISGCISTVAFHITIKAGKSAGINVFALPYQAIDRKAAMFMYYSFFIAIYLYNYLEEDIPKPNLQELFVNTAKLFVYLRGAEEIRPHIDNAIQIFKDAQNASEDYEGVSSWMETMMNTCLIYIMSWPSEKIQKHNLDFDQIFGSLLDSCMNAVE
jgi:hypothetical protein